MITTAIINRLLATSGVTSIVSTRIQPNIIKPGTPYPAIYVFSDRMNKLECFNPGGTRMGIIEIGVYTKSYPESHDLMQAIRASLDDFKGVIDNLGIDISRGQETADQYDEESETHIKVIEYEAIAEPRI